MHHLQFITELGVLLKEQDLEHVILCPGSRNAPLIQLFTSDPHFRTWSVVDERSAGYMALGMCRELGRPVAVVTTSGTAALNLHPAVAEAHHQDLPLLILTADRPGEELPQFNNQRIEQEGAFGAHVNFELQLEAMDDLYELEEEMSWCREELSNGLRNFPGPVHMNLLLEEPLYIPLPGALPGLLPAQAFYTERVVFEEEWESQEEFELVRPGAADRVLLLAGSGQWNERERELLEKLAGLGNVVVIAENLCLSGSEKLLRYPELVLGRASQEEKEDLKPDMVLAFGGQVVSKRLKLLVQEDPAIILGDLKSLVFEEGLEAVLEELLEELRGEDSGWAHRWKDLETRALEHSESYLARAGFSKPRAMHEIMKVLPEGSVLHLGNSTAIRLVQLMKGSEGHRSYSNRGTSGIDGCVSTAVGAALVSGEMHILILGDLSMAYDSNGLWNRDFPENLRIVVLNDHGGGIFRLLDGPSDMDFFEDYSVAHHPLSFSHLARAFGHEALSVKDLKGLTDALQGFWAETSPAQILEVDTSECDNSRIFKDLFRH